MWAFGSLPEETSLNVPARSKAKNPQARPFVYTWDEPRRASAVEIPTVDNSNKDDDGEVDDDEEASNNNEEMKEVKVSIEEATKDEERKDEALVGASAAGMSQTEQIKNGVPANKVEREEDGLEQKGCVKKRESFGAHVAEKEQTKGSTTDAKIATEENKTELMDVEGKIDAITVKAKNIEAGAVVEDSQQGALEKGKEESTEKEEMIKESSDAKSDTSTLDTPAKEAEIAKYGENSVSDTGKSPKSIVTYATTLPNEPPYTDAASKYPEKCAPDGSWTGYFENVSNRKDRLSSRVAEKFCLFFNACPPKDARILYVDDEQKMEKPKTSEVSDQSDSDRSIGLLSPGYVHVRGMGTNQFGTFELLGSLNIENGVLECQRMYVATVDTASSPRTKKSRSPSGSRTDTPEGTPRAYNTRKRPKMSWQRRSSLDDEDDAIAKRRNSGGSAKKRPRIIPPTPNGKLPMPNIPVLNATAVPKLVAVALPTSGSKRPSPRAGATPRKTSRSAPRDKSSSTSSSPTVYAKLPAAGDPREARWRAAHFLYYQRIDPPADAESGGGTKTSNNAAASYVVYEGEMLKGECLRDGRGVCLYSNGTLYEGDWKRNKEHGNGTLMSSDRKRIIYTGEWERGRMHGKGTYHYTDDVLFQRRTEDKGSGSRYEGDFKENARHGVGKYVLTDDSVYEGEWRDNVPSGRGSFRWMDGSLYVGQWKDGKRNGQGILQNFDGFSYDGTWIRNGMEGRGIATYPNGQRYEGLWAGGRREGRGTIHFTNGAVYEGRFRDDCMEGQGTMKMSKNVIIARSRSVSSGNGNSEASQDNSAAEKDDQKDDWMIPIHFQSDMGHIHQKAGFTVGGE